MTHEEEYMMLNEAKCSGRCSGIGAYKPRLYVVNEKNGYTECVMNYKQFRDICNSEQLAELDKLGLKQKELRRYFNDVLETYGYDHFKSKHTAWFIINSILDNYAFDKRYFDE